MDDTPRPQPQPMVTVEEIDEALHHTSKARHRNQHWQRWADALLDQRNLIQQSNYADNPTNTDATPMSTRT
jgi:hypothetical protein